MNESLFGDDGTDKSIGDGEFPVLQQLHFRKGEVCWTIGLTSIATLRGYDHKVEPLLGYPDRYNQKNSNYPA